MINQSKKKQEKNEQKTQNSNVYIYNSTELFLNVNK